MSSLWKEITNEDVRSVFRRGTYVQINSDYRDNVESVDYHCGDMFTVLSAITEPCILVNEDGSKAGSVRQATAYFLLSINRTVKREEREINPVATIPAEIVYKNSNTIRAVRKFQNKDRRTRNERRKEHGTNKFCKYEIWQERGHRYRRCRQYPVKGEKFCVAHLRMLDLKGKVPVEETE